jgi:hypothetical protein
MTRLPIALGLVLLVSLVSGCGGKGKAGTAGSGDGMAIMAKKMTLAWGIQQHGDSADIFLATTDETGAQVSHTIGTFPGQCVKIVPAREMGAVIGLACAAGSSGLELHAVQHDADVVILKLKTDQGVTSDPMAREEITRITAPAGAKIEAGS